MNNLNFNQSVGFPLETDILDSMQTAYGVLNALGAISGNFSIISGCILTGSTVANGVVYINGEVLEFRGGIVQTNVKIVEEIQALEFEDGNTNDVIFTRYVTFGTGTTQWAWSTFKRGMPTIDIEAALSGKATTASVTTLTEAVNSMITKLSTIAEYAEVNVNSDWNATSGDSHILNKPAIANVLRRGVVNIGDVGNATNIQVDFPTLTNSNYQVVGTLMSFGNQAIDFSTSICIVNDKQQNYFKLFVQETGNYAQNLKYEWMLIEF